MYNSIKTAMPLLRFRPFTLGRLIQSPARAATTPSRLYATQGYGDGTGDPKADDPQNQPASNSIKHDAEHPGPPPPAAGKGSGGGPTKGAMDSSSGGSRKNTEDASAQSGGAVSKEATETGRSLAGGQVSGQSQSELKGGKARPMIHDKSVPDAGNKKEEVEKHNREFEKGHDRATPAEPDKVDEKYWQGQGGADRDP